MNFSYERMGIDINLRAKDDVMCKYESYCIYIDISVSYFGNVHDKRTILASKEVIEVLRDDIQRLLENEEDEVDINGPEREENFYLCIKKPFNLPKKEQLIESGYSEEVVNDYLAPCNMFRFMICLRGMLTGVVYMSQITREELGILKNEMDQVMEIVGKSDSVKHIKR